MSGWTHSNAKIIRILQVLDRKFSEILQYYNYPQTDDIIQILSELETHTPNTILYKSFIIPEGDFVRRNPLRLRGVNLDLADSRFRELVRSLGYRIFSYDSSSFSTGNHVYVNALIINLGYWYMDYGSGIGGSGSEADVFPEVRDSVGIRIRIKEFEVETTKRILRDITNGSFGNMPFFVFLDESLNMAFTHSWSDEQRKQYASLVKGFVDFVMNLGGIPLGIFYTRAIDIVRGLGALGYHRIPVVMDKVIMDRFLEPYTRSSLFRVYSYAASSVGLDLYCIYIKLGRSNIIRVEFPKRILDEGLTTIEDIHAAVLVQSVLGGGFPYALQKSHEYAVISSAEQKVIIYELARRLNLPEVSLIYSMKRFRKRCPIE